MSSGLYQCGVLGLASVVRRGIIVPLHEGLDFRSEGAMAEADTRSGAARDISRARTCPDCGADVARELRYCSACGRFVRGARSRCAWVATAGGAVLWLGFIALMLLGYWLVPILGFIAESGVWLYVIVGNAIGGGSIEPDEPEVSGQRVLIGVGIGLVLLAIAAAVMKLCGVGG